MSKGHSHPRKPDEDKDLVERAKSGDTKAFDELVVKYAREAIAFVELQPPIVFPRGKYNRRLRTFDCGSVLNPQSFFDRWSSP